MANISNGAVVAFINVTAGTCLDLKASDPTNGTPVIGYQYNRTKNQQWKLEKVDYKSYWPVFMLRNVQTGTYMDLYNGGKDNGTAVVGWAGGNTTNTHQLWRFVNADPNGNLVMIQNVGSNTYIDLYLGSSENLTKITGWAGSVDSENPHQLWKVQAAN